MPSWAEALAGFGAYLTESALTPGTVTGYVGDLRSYAAWLSQARGQDVLPDQFTPDDVAGYVQHLLETRRLSPVTINRRLQSVRKFSRYAVESGIRDTNPAEGVPLLRNPEVRSARALGAAEAEQLDTAARQRSSRSALRDRAILQLLLDTGVRVKELVGLRLGDLEIGAEQAAITVRPAAGGIARRLELSLQAQDALRAYVCRERRGEAEALIVSRDGLPLSVRTVQQIVAELGKAAGLRISSKTLRNTFARRLWQETGDLALVAQRLGYRRPETAIKHIVPLVRVGPTTEDLAQRPALQIT